MSSDDERSAAAIERVTANGLRFAYLSEGEGPLVLLLHGFPDTPQTWDAVRPAVAAAGFRAVTPFTRGYHPTEIPKEEDFGIETLARDALALIEALGHESATIVGHDWGAAAGYSAAAMAPASIDRLVTSAVPHPAATFGSPRILWAFRHFLSLSRPGAADKLRRGNLEHIGVLVRRWSPAWDVPPGELDAVLEAFAEPGCLEAALGYYRGVRLTLPDSYKRPIEVPTVSFAGLDDVVAPSFYDRARKYFRGPYEVVRMPGGHFMHREHPEVFIEHLLPRLRGESAGDGD